MKSFAEKFAGLAAGFYTWSAAFAGKLSRFLPASRISSWSNRRFFKPPGLVGIEVFVGLSLVVYFFFLLLPQAETPRAYDGNELNIYLFTYLSDHPYTQRDLIAEFGNWKARLAGPMITGWLYDLSYNTFTKLVQLNLVDTDKFVFGGYFARVPVVVFGCYHALWLFLLYGLLILYRRDALLIMFGVFAGLMYNFTRPSGQWFYPWDLPVLLFFTWACLLYDRRRLLPLIVVVWLGSLFKETVLCCSLLILLGEHWPWKKRIVGFAVAAAACLLTRKFLMAVYGVHTLFFALNNSGDFHEFAAKTWTLFAGNIRLLFGLHLNHVLFANAGALLLMMLIPWRNRRDVVLKILALVFIIGQFLCGIIIEFRVWYEILPLGWIVISEALSRRYAAFMRQETGPALPATDAMAADRRNRVFKGSYLLVGGGLLLLALAVFFFVR